MVLLIVIILLGYTVAMFPLQQELKQYRKADAEMEEIIEHLIGFAQVNGRLPCPDDNADGNTDGLEDRNGPNNCDGFYGFLPARTLGINGNYNSDGLLIDPWGTGYVYAVSQDPGVINADIDLVTPNGIRDEGMNNVQPDLFLCDDSTTLGDHLDCAAVTGGVEVIGNVAAVVLSYGKDFDLVGTSNIQAENADDFLDGTNDKVYIFSPRRDDYDDIVKWISPNLLFSKMIEADQLP